MRSCRHQNAGNPLRGCSGYPPSHDRTELLFDVLSRQLASALQDAADDEPGPALRQVEGDRPMTIVWRLARPLPASLFRDFSVLRGA
jgi:hypothetical protein